VTVVPKSLDRNSVQVIKLPTSAFFQDGSKSAVWVLDTGTMTVRLQPVQIATADGNDVVVVAGLAPGMQVVSAGVHVLSPGQKVTIYKENGAVAPAAPAQAASNSVAPSNTTPAGK
jgi:multidrug efflux pump subunit AcrA (membrane-fusion protein)